MLPVVSRKLLQKQDAAIRVWVQKNNDPMGGDYKATVVQVVVAR
jgi:hypothetical protein